MLWDSYLIVVGYSSQEEYRHKAVFELEDDLARGVIQIGCVYFAWSDCLHCMKIGATRREDPMIRLQELSRHVTSPFKLCGVIRTATPFRLEAKAHAHFDGRRLNRRGQGVGTEFFAVCEKEVGVYLATGV